MLRPPKTLSALLLVAASCLAQPAYGAGTIRLAADLELPVYATGLRYQGRELLYVVEQRGLIRVYEAGQEASQPFLDLQSLVWTPTQFDERGMLGLAFDPAFATNGRLYLLYSNNQNQTTLARLSIEGGDPLRANPNSRQTLLVVPQVRPNHKGGWIGFGPDGFLYVNLGDDGACGECPDHPSQDGTVLFGKVLRLDVSGTGAYTIPPDNPFVSDPGFRDEIWDYGYRNPWRASFDRETGNFWVGDVGRNDWEEINFESTDDAGGRNFGWPTKQGDHCYNPPIDCDETGLTDPIHEYAHTIGCSVTGGYVYRGSAIPTFQGLYFFGDFCTSRIWSFRYQNGVKSNFLERTTQLAPGNGLALEFISSFGENWDGELLIVDYGTGVDGEVYLMVNNPTDVATALTEPTTIRLLSRNPFSDWIRFDWSGPVNSVEILDASGRRLTRISSAGGPFAWDGTNAAGAPAPSGTYWIRAAGREPRAVQLIR